MKGPVRLQIYRVCYKNSNLDNLVFFSGTSEPPSILKEMFLQAMELQYRATNEKMVC